MTAEPILIVGRRTRQRLTPILGSQPALWSFAPDVSSAREELTWRKFHVVVSEMPVCSNGDPLLEMLKAEFPAVSLVYVTAPGDMASAVIAFRAGVSDLLIEPLQEEQTRAILERAAEMTRERSLGLVYRRNMQLLVEQRSVRLRTTMLELERSYDVTLEAMGDALDLRDEETEGHSKRVTAYTIALARAMRLSSAELKVIARGAFLHDIGKIAVPDGILLKPGRLTPEEMEIMRTHCERGYRMVRKIPFLEEAAEIVYAHQEMFDGRGYPRGLRGHEIPLGARIFALADSLDAMTSDRPYRKGRTFSLAIEEIERCRGTQFDPEIVDVFLSLPEETWSTIRAEVGRDLHASELVRAAAA